MDIFHKLHVQDDALRTVGRSAMRVGAPDPEHLGVELEVTVYHPTSKAKRSFVLDPTEVAELAQTLNDWLAGGWDEVIPVLEAERE